MTLHFFAIPALQPQHEFSRRATAAEALPVFAYPQPAGKTQRLPPALAGASSALRVPSAPVGGALAATDALSSLHGSPTNFPAR
ncbi:hypothetical protein A1355_24005 [Methylomonas koyamae]|uniref:Uncharacterized protein n=1 Tax=Methylomonas koyamae TaxID=702114 RepID=A0A177NQT1_9GAMM|nr:hypothetical protein A1355_24005 [Methylomonas koyamae]